MCPASVFKSETLATASKSVAVHSFLCKITSESAVFKRFKVGEGNGYKIGLSLIRKESPGLQR